MSIKTFSMPPGGERLVSIRCPICGEGRTRVCLRCEGFVFSRCLECGHVYQNPQPIFDDLVNRYQESYFSYERENEQAFFNLMLLGLQDIDFDRIERGLGAAKRFLDIGCATGLLIAHMRERGWDVQGVEICQPAARYGIQTRCVPIFIGPLEKAGLAEESFDVIHFSHLIEHIGDPRAFLLAVWRLLKNRGHLIVVTPNVQGFQSRLLGARWRSAIADHLHLFNRANLARLLRETGFEPRAWQTWGGLAKGLAPDFIKFPIDRLAKRFHFGDVMLCHARK